MRTILLGLLASLALAAQGSADDYSFSGVVLNSVTGAPVKGAVVTLVALPKAGVGAVGSPNESGPLIAASRTGAGGEFLFSGLTAGQYVVGAAKPGYVSGSGQAQFQDAVTLSASVSGHAIRLAPLGAIEGTVSNQHGERLAGVSIWLFERHVEDGVRSLRQRPGGTTDDRGQFRVWDLPPGDYYVQARRGAAVTTMMSGYATIRYASWEGFRPVYFGGARDLDSATPVAVAAGGQAHADFNIAVEPAYKVRGRLEGSGGDQPTIFEWLDADPHSGSRTFAEVAAFDPETGKFEIDGVPSGLSTLRVTQGNGARGETNVTVKDGDVNGILVVLARAVTVTGTLRLSGPGPESARGASGMAPAVACYVSLLPPEPESAVTRELAGGPQGGEFALAAVLPGLYRFRVACSNGYLVSAVSGGADLLSNPWLAVAAGATPPAIEIVVKAGGGNLRGKLAVSDAPLGTGVLLLPAFATSSGPEVQLASQMMPGVTNGLGFAFRCLAPGEYRLYAFSDIQSVEFRNPVFLKSLAGGTSVRIEDGKTAEVTLGSLVR